VYRFIATFTLVSLGFHNVCAQTTSAPEIVMNDSVDLRIMQLESEIAALRSAVCCSAATQSKCTNRCSNQGGWEAGASIFVAKPQMKESFQSTVFDATTGTLNLIPFAFDHEVAPRVWLGYFGGSGSGIRARYWQYDHNAAPMQLTATPTTFPGASAVNVIFPAAITSGLPGDTLITTSGLEVHTLDLEGAMRKELMGIDMLASAGFRWASMEQYYDSTIISGVAPPSILNWIREFEGGGLTASAEARKWMGDTALAVVGSARGSLLFGEKKIQRVVVGDVTPTPNNPPIINFVDADEVSGIFDLSVGAQWARQMNNGSEFFVSCMYETQLWTAAGAPTLTFLGFDGVNLSFGLRR
jgi:hypothetical protein